MFVQLCFTFKAFFYFKQTFLNYLLNYESFTINLSFQHNLSIHFQANVLSWETKNWCEIQSLKVTLSPGAESKLTRSSISLLHNVTSEIQLDKTQIRLLGFDTQVLVPYRKAGKLVNWLRIFKSLLWQIPATSSRGHQGPESILASGGII